MSEPTIEEMVLEAGEHAVLRWITAEEQLIQDGAGDMSLFFLTWRMHSIIHAHSELNWMLDGRTLVVRAKYSGRGTIDFMVTTDKLMKDNKIIQQRVLRPDYVEPEPEEELDEDS